MAILGPFWPESGDSEPGFGLPVKFCAGTHRFQNFWTSVTVFRDFWPFFEGISRFGARIRILREKLYRIALISEFFDLCEAISDHISDFSDFGIAILAVLAIVANLANGFVCFGIVVVEC